MLMIKIYSTPSIEIEIVRDIENYFKEGKDLCFEFPEKYATGVRGKVDMIYRSLTYAIEQIGVWSKLRFILYFIYSELNMMLYARGRKEIQHTLFVYRVCGKNVKEVIGERIGNGVYRIKFVSAYPAN